MAKTVWKSDAERHASLKRLCYRFAWRTELALKAEHHKPVPDLVRCRELVDAVKWFNEFDPADPRYKEMRA